MERLKTHFPFRGAAVLHFITEHCVFSQLPFSAAYAPLMSNTFSNQEKFPTVSTWHLCKKCRRGWDLLGLIAGQSSRSTQTCKSRGFFSCCTEQGETSGLSQALRTHHSAHLMKGVPCREWTPCIIQLLYGCWAAPALLRVLSASWEPHSKQQQAQTAWENQQVSCPTNQHLYMFHDIAQSALTPDWTWVNLRVIQCCGVSHFISYRSIPASFALWKFNIHYTHDFSALKWCGVAQTKVCWAGPTHCCYMVLCCAHSASTHRPAEPLGLTSHHGPPCIQALPFHWQYHFWAAGSQNAAGNS